jgi:HEAT repeat protein
VRIIMNRNLTISLVLLGLMAPQMARAQDEEAPPGKKPAAPKLADRPAERPDLVLESIRESNPTTPEALTQAVQTLLDYGAPAEAKKYLTKLMDAKPDEGALRDLHRRFGSAFFLQLSRDERMAPEGKQLSDSVMSAAQAAARDAKRLDALVDQLRDPSEGIRRAAVVELHDAGQLALPPLIHALADDARTAEHAAIRDAMLELSDLSIEPLLGALEAPDEAFRVRVIDALGRLHARRAVESLIRPYLFKDSSATLRQAARAALLRIIGDAPTQYDGEQYLFRRAKSHLAGEPPRRPSYAGWVELWHWDEGQKVPFARRYPAADAALVAAVKTASDLYALAPQNADYRRLYLTAGLEMQKTLAGFSQPLPQGPGTVHAAAAAAGAPVLEDVLTWALKQNHVAAAIGVCEILGNIGDAGLLASRGDNHSPLAQALRHGDPRLRFAAALAILRLDPRESYPGSSQVLETLGRAVATSGARRALIVHPQAAAGQTLVGLLNGIGLEADTAATGKQGFKLAAGGTDYEIVLISDAVDQPNANELLQMLRRDPRTARLPVGLMFRAESEQRMRRIAEDDPLAQAMPRPHSPESIGFEVSRLYERVGRLAVTPAERLVQASIALDRINYLAEHASQYPFYDLLRLEPAVESALYVPELTGKASEVLGRLGNPAAQQVLVNLANQNTLPLVQRQAAAAGFIQAVKVRGTLLTTAEIRNQYDLYNKSEGLDQETQGLLASILDAIESRAKLTAAVTNKEE